jgi:colicin import membrane protein
VALHNERSYIEMSTADERTALQNEHWARRAEYQAQEREQELRELREDPRTIAAVRQGEQERAEREAEAERRRRIEAELRESEARSRLQKEKERHRRLWIAAGNPAESFERHWPEIEKRTLMDNYEERARGRYESII